MTPTEFVAAVGTYADAAAAATGLNRWAILTQWGLETGWGSPTSTFGLNNLAGIIYHDLYSNENGFTLYPDLDAFVTDYVAVLRQPNMAVILASAGQDVSLQLVAFGESPWAASHYDNGNGPGSSLVGVWQTITGPLAAAASSPPAAPVVPPPSSESGGLDVNDRDYLYSQLVKVAHTDGVTLDTPPWASPTARTYTVKPGDSLWAIASEFLGDGARYPEIYALNKDLIGPDPNLIHPGQVLTLPNQ